MKIIVLEWNIGRISGRMSTMVRFADAFKRLGHEVKISSSFSPAEIEKKEHVLKRHQAKYLTNDDLDWEVQITPPKIPDWWRDYDLVFAAYPAWGKVAKMEGCPAVICWQIIKDQGNRRKLVKEHWTNSNYNRQLLKTDRWTYPPYDYSIFREAAKPWADRYFDVCYATRCNTPQKQVNEWIHTVKQLNLKAAICAITADWVVRDSGFKVWADATKEQVARMMGNSLLYFHPSTSESASIAVYEALNAGCWPVVYETGAIWEQLGTYGRIYRGEAPETVVKQELKKIKYLLTLRPMDFTMQSIIRWGERFDIEANIDKIAAMLKDVEDKIHVGIEWPTGRKIKHRGRMR